LWPDALRRPICNNNTTQTSLFIGMGIRQEAYLQLLGYSLNCDFLIALFASDVDDLVKAHVLMNMSLRKLREPHSGRDNQSLLRCVLVNGVLSKTRCVLQSSSFTAACDPEFRPELYSRDKMQPLIEPDLTRCSNSRLVDTRNADAGVRVTGCILEMLGRIVEPRGFPWAPLSVCSLLLLLAWFC